MSKLSAVLIEMASTVLRSSHLAPSTEAAHAALLLAHVAWNRELHPGKDSSPTQYQEVLKEFAKSKPDFAKELKSDDFEALIAELRAYKRCRHPADTRFIMVCGMTPEGKVHVEWKE